MNIMTYEPPKIEILFVEVEQGFAASITSSINGWEEQGEIEGNI